MPQSLTLTSLVLILSLLTGCSHSQAPLPTATGSPEALALVNQLRSQNTQPPAISGTFTWTTTQPQSAYVAEQTLGGDPMLKYLSPATTRPSTQPAETIALREYARDMLKDGPPQGTHTEIRRYEQRQQGKLFYVSCTSTTDGVEQYPLTISTWNGKIGYCYQPSRRWAQRSMDYRRFCTWYGAPADVRTFSSHIPFPVITGQVTLRHEQLNGEDLVVLHEDLRDLYREYYLSPKDDYAPRRILQRMKQRRTMPEQDVAGTIEYETGKWPFRHRETRRFTTPAAPMKFLDWDYGVLDMDTTITAATRRPDGQWFVTESTTSFPFFHRTETFKAADLSFTPLPASAFEIQLPANVQVRH